MTGKDLHVERICLLPIAKHPRCDLDLEQRHRSPAAGRGRYAWRERREPGGGSVGYIRQDSKEARVMILIKDGWHQHDGCIMRIIQRRHISKPFIVGPQMPS